MVLLPPKISTHISNSWRAYFKAYLLLKDKYPFPHYSQDDIYNYYVCDFSLKANEQRRSELFAKQGRSQQFSSVKERDAWIKKVWSLYNNNFYRC